MNTETSALRFDSEVGSSGMNKGCEIATEGIATEGMELGPALDGLNLALIRLDVELWRLELFLQTSARP